MSPGTMLLKDTMALAGEVAMSSVPVLNILAPAFWASVKNAPVEVTRTEVINAPPSRAIITRRPERPEKIDPKSPWFPMNARILSVTVSQVVVGEV